MKVLDKIKLVKNFACFRPPPARKNRPEPTTYRNPLQLVQREIAILKKLRHPNVVKLVEVILIISLMVDISVEFRCLTIQVIIIYTWYLNMLKEDPY